MSEDGLDRLVRLLGAERLAPLRERLRRHFERADPDPSSNQTLRLGRLQRHEYEALASLMGRPPRSATSIEVDIAVIDASLARAGLALSLRAALEQLDGPIVHAASARAAADAQWRAVVDGCGHAGLAALLAEPVGIGLLKRLARSDPQTGCELRDRATAALQRLPADGLTRAQLSADTLGDAHALDAGRAVASLVLAVLRRASAVDRLGFDDETPPAAAREERARTLWARAGVLVNELARPALVLNLPTSGGSCAGSCPGEPHYLSLRSLLRRPPVWAVAGQDVYVCENPNVLAIAADRLGVRSRPLLCTEGMPAAAQRTLLEQIAHAGGRMHYHGDFDWPGLRIAEVVMRMTGALPWRFRTSDYLAAVASAPAHPHPLSGRPSEASWDPSLTMAMSAHHLAIAEEAVVECLISDLRG